MEAVSARMAARDRFGAMGDPGPSHLQRYIQQACSPENFEPNLALNLEISDLINSKKGNAPREAAVAIVNYINHRNPNVSLLALNLLDICVKNCGYPFHLQISTKEFLNELVRRFPERPPIRPTRVQQKILEAIEEWRGTICMTSRYKEDLGFIRDMHRLLSYKGYVFPEVRTEDAAVLNPSDNLKSAEEMEEEERAAQSAKLQELIRRGGPEDLQEANRLMKVMAGYDTRHKTDYRAKAAEEVGKVQQKAMLLEERLEAFQPGDKMTDGDVYEELASALQSAHPKIQKMCEEESDDHEAVAKLLEINDSIHRTVERYRLMKKGDVDAASKIAKGTLGTSTGVAKNADNELSLIDFDPESNASAPVEVPAQGPAGSVEDDLLGLSLGGDKGYGQGGGISLGFGNNTTSDIPGPALISSTTEYSTARGPTPTRSPAPPSAPAVKPDYSAFSAFGPPQLASKPATPQPSLFQQQEAVMASKPQPPISASDPFAALASPVRQATPQQAQPSMFDFGNHQAPAPAAAPATDDDEWAFSSALPEGLPPSNTIEINNTALNISLHATREPQTPSIITMALTFSSRSDEPISELTFMAAVTKGYSLKLQPQSGRRLQPHETAGVKQIIYLNGAEQGQGESVKVRWKASYRIGARQVNEQGEVSSLGIA
ncbi:putative vhs-containing protein [Venustampulla echinocandica]|uniref:Putative vhs-containing protein n=1 Tax=Venustampulla echinocandica TaxID=2656787 RepID=A0A370TDS1_9HELO|nr:putative vhs-containing protein [Venustampulla echinocandica]RDL32610.1 putative vhs-containing protein [Venustampulla echinocandica]